MGLKTYRCTRCNRGPEDGIDREHLMVKRVLFQNMGEGGRIHKSRNLAWLCPACVAKDADWQRPPRQMPTDG